MKAKTSEIFSRTAKASKLFGDGKEDKAFQDLPIANVLYLVHFHGG